MKWARSDAVGSSIVTSTASSAPRLRCVATSNRRIDSTSLPKSSIRTGSSASGGKMSRMPPRSENSPGSSTAVVACPPRATSHFVNSCSSSVPADANLARRLGQRIAPRHRLQQALDAGDEDASRMQGARSCELDLPAPCSCSLLLPAPSTPAAARHRSHRAPPARPAPIPKPETPRPAACVKSVRSRAIESISPGCGATTTSGPGDSPASAAATSAREDPQTPPSVPPCPAWRLATTSAKPRCDSRFAANSRSRCSARGRSAAEVAAVAVSMWRQL